MYSTKIPDAGAALIGNGASKTMTDIPYILNDLNLLLTEREALALLPDAISTAIAPPPLCQCDMCQEAKQQAKAAISNPQAIAGLSSQGVGFGNPTFDKSQWRGQEGRSNFVPKIS